MKYNILPLLLILTLCSACTKKEETTAAIDTQIRQYLSLVEAKQNPKPDLNQIKTCYNALSGILTQAGLKAQADEYLAQTETAANIDPLLEGIEKTFQQAVVVLIRNELDLIQSNPKNAGKHLNALSSLYRGIKSTAERRGKYIGSETLFTETIQDSIQNIRNGSETEAMIQKIKTTLDDIYFLSVLYELEGIIANRGVNEIVVQEKQIEGSLFFEIIRSSSQNKEAGDKIRAEWTKPGNDIDIDLIKENLKIAFPEKSVLYKNKF